MAAAAAVHDRTTVAIGYDGSGAAQGAVRWAAEYAASTSRRRVIHAWVRPLARSAGHGPAASSARPWTVFRRLRSPGEPVAPAPVDVDGTSRSSGARDSPPRGQELLDRAGEARTRAPQLLISVDLREGRAAMS